MTPAAIITVISAYFAVILFISWFTGRKSDNAGFFSGNRKQSWYVVAIAMIGSAMSGVTFVSVPGMVATSGFGYMQMALGFIAGQIVIAFVLIPLFYRMNLVSIYGYLETGSAFHPTAPEPGSSSFPRCWEHRSDCTSCALPCR